MARRRRAPPGRASSRIGVETAAQAQHLCVNRGAALLGVLQFFRTRRPRLRAGRSRRACRRTGRDTSSRGRFDGQAPSGVYAKISSGSMGYPRRRRADVGVVRARSRRNASPTACVPAAPRGGDRTVGALLVEGPRKCGPATMSAATSGSTAERAPRPPCWPKRLVSRRPSLSHDSIRAGVNSGRSTAPTPSHDDAEPSRVFAPQLQARILQAKSRCPDGKAHGPRHDLHACGGAAGTNGRDVEIMHLGRDLDRMGGRVETTDWSDAAFAVQAGRPESIFADALGARRRRL